MSYHHVPVMPTEVLHYLDCRPGKIIADCTLGGAGHARLILGSILPGGTLIGIDRDRDAIAHGKVALASHASSVQLFRDNFVCLGSILRDLGIAAVDGILLDLGASLHHFEFSGRGFSFSRDEPLDMRMDVRTHITAERIINRSSEKELKRLFSEYGEEHYAGRIAKRIAAERAVSPITSTQRLSEVIRGAVPGSSRSLQAHHPGTRVFMALRIAVNQELAHLSEFMETVADLLNPGGRFCALSFHSLEDRIVKHRLKALEKGCDCPPDFPTCVCNKKRTIRFLAKKAIRPTDAEIRRNPMARSARLRAVERLG